MLISPLHQKSALSQPPEMKVRGFKIRCGNICQEACTTAYRQNHSLNSLLGAWRKPLASITLLSREANPHGRDARATWHGHLAHAVLVVKARCMRATRSRLNRVILAW